STYLRTSDGCTVGFRASSLEVDMSVTDDRLAELVSGRQAERVEETNGLVRSPLPTPMLQPFEVYDQNLFDVEMVRVFGRSWVFLGDTEDLANPGDFITAGIGYQSVLVIRQEDGSVKGFLNNCRHRAS